VSRARELEQGEEGSGEVRTSGILKSRQPDGWPVPDDDASLLWAGRPAASEEAIGRATAELARALAGAPSETALAERTVAVLRAAFPGRRIEVRLSGPEGGALAASDGARDAAGELEPGCTLEVMLGERGAGALFVGAPTDAPGPEPRADALAPLAACLSLALEAVRGRRERDLERARVAWLVEKTAAPAFLMDGTGHVRAVSEGAGELLGQRPADMVGRKVLELAAAGTAELAEAELRRVQRGEPIDRLEMNTRRQDGGMRVIWSAAPVRDADGAIDSILALGKDLTAVALLEDQIVHAEKLATLGQLAAGVVHELNNPLTSITLYTDYLLQKSSRAGGDPGDIERLRRIADAASRMLRFTRDLVTYARPSTEEPAAVSLRDVLAQSAGFCEHVLHETGVTFELDAPRELPPVRGLRGQLQQVFVNLYTNAAHAIAEKNAEEGTLGGRIEVRVTIEGRDALVRVRDDGPGIRAEHQGKVFEPFFSTKVEGKGTGLGLSIVRNIVRLHGGSMELESRHREGGHTQTGTTFVLRLPLVEG
jgi:two-component system NtrC family sensor kinase